MYIQQVCACVCTGGNTLGVTGDRLRRHPHDSRLQPPALEVPLLDAMHFGDALLDWLSIPHPLF
jgi:hypothetical protein